MGKKIFVVALLATLFVSCSSKKSALNFNNDLVKIENSLIAPLESDGKNLTQYLSEEKYDSVYAIGDRMENLLQAKINEAEALKTPDIKQAENFKKSYIKAFKAFKEVFTAYKKIGVSKTAEERQKLTESLQGLAEEQLSATRDMQAAQRIYATTNGFKLEKE